MNKFMLEHLVFIEVFVAAVFFPQLIIAIKLKCTNIDEFYYAHPDSHCTGYYRCTSRGKFDGGECEPGSMFDFYTQTCTRGSGVCYEPICTGRTNGIYQDTTHACRRSFTCYAGRTVNIDNCPSGYLHNGLKCVEQDLVMCELPQTTSVAYPYQGDKRCVGKSDDNYGFDDCRNYLVCRNQELVDIKQCPKAYRFKDSIKECALAHEVPYCPFGGESNLCRTKRDGHHADPTSSDCSKYIICENGNYISKEKCSNTAVFNGVNCVPTPLYTCPTNGYAKSNDFCKKKSNGFHSNPQENCSSYIRCMDERTVEVFNCPKGQYFDPDERNCVHEKFEERRKCKEPIVSADCSNKAKGFYQSDECQKYYYCLNGKKTEYDCPANKIFNGESCVSKSRYKCPLNEENSCYQKADGYYKEQDSCRGYFYCSNGNKISYRCEDNHIFDGNKCMKSNQSNKCKLESKCYGKSDGYHFDLLTHCRNYYYCEKNEKITELSCRDNKIFNGSKCVSSNEYTCPSSANHNQKNCMPRICSKKCLNDGFYQDLDSNCRNYFFCIAGRLSELSCPIGQLFDGEICTAEDKIICPSYCDDRVKC